ncbi:7030_t:CDS:2, partial [Cetraspora pellucida]
MPKINIAIDGPVGSGKTTIGRLVAQKLNYQFLDSDWFLIDNPEIAVQLEQQRDVLGSEKIGNLASQLAIIKELRTIILNCQRLLTQNKGWLRKTRPSSLSAAPGKNKPRTIENWIPPIYPQQKALSEYWTTLKEKNINMSSKKELKSGQEVSSNVLAEIEDIVE